MFLANKRTLSHYLELDRLIQQNKMRLLLKKKRIIRLKHRLKELLFVYKENQPKIDIRPQTPHTIKETETDFNCDKTPVGVINIPDP
jgi:hypothetical protein